MDRLQSSIEAALPLLREMRDGLGRQPTVPAEALSRLRRLALSPREEPCETATGSQAARTDESATSPSMIAGREWTLDTLRAAALRCTECPHLVRSRKQVVFGVGNPRAELMFVGEAPGAEEDEQGEPFVGRAGQLLTKIIQTMGYSRDTVYIGNVLKCRPDMPAGSTGNRKPRPGEMQTCLPWLEKQIDLIRPGALVALGA
ncbi:MAG: uracil-DNA glycosylase, partial [Terrimicrobiaceae bacterium]|nr:uracil-DNA glycosylase [Terrimicrobiaceae bacterium]